MDRFEVAEFEAVNMMVVGLADRTVERLVMHVIDVCAVDPWTILANDVYWRKRHTREWSITVTRAFFSSA